MVEGREPPAGTLDEGQRPSVVGLGVLYTLAVIVCPFALFLLWLMEFGFKGWHPDTQAAIPGWLALALAPVIGILLGWRTPLAQGSRNLTPVVAPAIPFALAVLAYPAGVYGPLALDLTLEWFGLVALYAFGPVVLGRLLRLARVRLRSRPT